MSTFTGQPSIINATPQSIADRFADLSKFAAYAEQMPAEERARMGQIEFAPDAIIINNPQIGQMRFEVTECTPGEVRLQCSSPVPMALVLHLQPVDDGTQTQLTTEIDIDVPPMLRPFIAPQMQKAADQFGLMMAKMATANA